MHETTPTVIKYIMYAVLMLTAPMMSAGDAEKGQPPMATPPSQETIVSQAQRASTTPQSKIQSPHRMSSEQLDAIVAGLSYGPDDWGYSLPNGDYVWAMHDPDFGLAGNPNGQPEVKGPSYIPGNFEDPHTGLPTNPAHTTYPITYP